MRKLNFAFAASALLALTGCGSAPETPSADTDTVAAEAPPAVKVYAVGQSVTAASFEFTLKSVEERAKAADSPFAEPAGPGEVFVVAKFAIKNLGSKPIDTSSLPKPELLDGEGTAYSEDILNSAFASDESGLDDVNPGVTYRSALAWKVAKGAFDPAKWKIVVRADPAFEYRLK